MRPALLAAAALIAALIWLWPKHKAGTIKVGKTVVKAERAVRPWEKARGLSGREALDKDAGMLFVYSQAGKYPFWMNGMKFDLDFIFISGNQVVEIIDNVPAPKTGEQPITVTPRRPADKILEVNAGFAAKHGIKIGDRVE